MKNSVKNLLTAAVAIVIILTAVSAVFSYFALTKDFDHDIFHFETGSVNAAVGMYLPMTVPVIGLVCALFIRKKVSFREAPAANIPTVFTSVLAGLLLIVSAFFSFTGDGELSRISVGVAVAAVISGLYFLFLPFVGNKSFMIFLSFSPAVWAALKLLEEYFRQGEPINSPIRTVNLTMFALLLLFFAEEIRFGIDRQITGVYYFCILSALAFTGNAVFPKLAIILTGNAGFDFAFIDWCLGAAIFMFLLARLSALPAVLGDYAPPVGNIDETPIESPAEAETEVTEENPTTGESEDE